MGAALVKSAFAYACEIPLSPNEFRLLAFMALTALDGAETPRYFDSREASALGLGRRIVDDGQGTDDDQRERAAALEAVKVALRGLVNVGAIIRIRGGRSGQRAEYQLRLDVASSRSTLEFRRRLGEGGAFRAKKAPPSPKRRMNLPSGEGSSFPQGTTQETQGQTRGDNPTQASTSLAVVDNAVREAS